MDKGTVLIVEDDNIIAQDLKLTLEKLGYGVADIVMTGEDAIKKAVELSPDIIMMDIVLKGAIDGVKAAGHIIKNYNIPVIYLTSHSDRVTLERAKKTGSHGYILKPFAEAELRATLEMVSYKHDLETQLKEREHWLDVILSSIGDAVVVTDSEGLVKYMNPAAEFMTGLPFKKAVGKHPGEVFSIVSYATEKPAPDLVGQVLKGKTGAPPAGEQMILHGEGGREVPVDIRAYATRDESGRVTDVVLVLSDVSERVEAIRLLQESERFLNTIFDSIYDPFCIIDREYNIVRANQGYAALKGLPVEMFVGRRCYEAVEDSRKVCDGCIVEQTFKYGEPRSKEKYHASPEGGGGIWVEIFTYPIRDTDGEISHVVEYSRIITERKKAEEDRKHLIKELEHLSRTDGLTGLMNRRALMENLEHEVRRSIRYKSDLSMALCDIDNFKEINDTFGHATGDRALERVADALLEMARKSDVIGRYGGDEFLLILPETTVEGAREFAERLKSTLGKANFSADDGTPIVLSLSFGVTAFDAESDTPDSFITRADHAMYDSKREGRNRVTIKKS